MKIKEILEGTDPLEDRIDQLASELTGLANKLDLGNDDSAQVKLKELENDLQIYRDMAKDHPEIDVDEKIDELEYEIEQVMKEIG